jgi:hypothetical protein
MNSAHPSPIRPWSTAWSHFFHNHVPTQPFAILRIGFALVILIIFLTGWADAQKWFGPRGILSFDASRAIVDPDTLTLFQLFPQSETAVTILYSLVIIQAACLLLGLYGRFQAACLFILLASFHHRNCAWCDGEDTFIRHACFFMVFMPVDACWSLRSLLPRTRSRLPATSPAWPLRLFQFQMAIIYLSTGILKFQGQDWHDGSAVYYSLNLIQYQRFPLPDLMRQSLLLSQLSTWGVLTLELALPFILFIPRLRLFAIASGILLHLSIEYSLNLFLFEWAMIIGLLSFLPFPLPHTAKPPL